MTRKAVFERSGYRCENPNCGRPARLECDHVIPLHQNPLQNPYDPDGCQALCKPCHLAKSLAERGANPRPTVDRQEKLAWSRLVLQEVVR